MTRLKVLSTPPTRAPLTKWTRLGSARAAIKRGRTVSRSPSSALNQITLPCGALPSSHGSAIKAVTDAAMKAAICPLPMSGKPAISPNLPLAKRPGHSQSTPRISRSAALLITSLSSRYAFPLATTFSVIRSISLSTEHSPFGNERPDLLPGPWRCNVRFEVLDARAL